MMETTFTIKIYNNINDSNPAIYEDVQGIDEEDAVTEAIERYENDCAEYPIANGEATLRTEVYWKGIFKGEYLVEGEWNASYHAIKIDKNGT